MRKSLSEKAYLFILQLHVNELGSGKQYPSVQLNSIQFVEAYECEHEGWILLIVPRTAHVERNVHMVLCLLEMLSFLLWFHGIIHGMIPWMTIVSWCIQYTTVILFYQGCQTDSMNHYKIMKVDFLLGVGSVLNCSACASHSKHNEQNLTKLLILLEHCMVVRRWKLKKKHTSTP